MQDGQTREAWIARNSRASALPDATTSGHLDCARFRNFVSGMTLLTSEEWSHIFDSVRMDSQVIWEEAITGTLLATGPYGCLVNI
jgi:hypothetical protein